MGFTRRLSAWLGLVLLVLLPTLALSLASLRSLNGSQAAMHATHVRTMVLARDIAAATARQNELVPVYVREGDEGVLVALDRANRDFDGAVAGLLTQPVGDGIRDLARNVRELGTGLRSMESAGIAMRRSGKPAAEVDGWFRQEAGPLVERMAVQVRSLQSMTDAAYENRRTREATRFATAFLALAGACAAAAAAAVAGMVVLVRMARHQSSDVEGRERAADRDRALARSRKEAVETVAHDLKNPLSAIVMATEHALGAADLASGGRVHRMLEVVAASAASMSTLVSNILDHAKIESGTLVLAREPTDLGAVVSRILRSHGVVARERGVTVLESVEAGLPLADADPVRVEQVLSNLLGNALKFTPTGGTVRVSVSARDGALDLCVADDGPGLPPEVAARAFDRGTQGREGAARGCGLGLSICKAVVEAHGGTITVRSEPGRGAAFVASLPSVAARA